ncbi:MAG: hypothetical protein OXG35_01045 [Acidobacteria bacterium]|nr:hypothetical protein [Acidobacteriota bacterium]
MQIGHIIRRGAALMAVTGALGGSAAGEQSFPADGREGAGGGSAALAQSSPADGREPAGGPGMLAPEALSAQSLPADGLEPAGVGSPRPGRASVEARGGRPARSAQGDQPPQATYFDSGGLHLALGAASFWQQPTAQPEAATFLSAGLHLGRSVAVVAEMGRGWWADGRLETPGRAGPAAACSEIQAGFHTFMGGVQYRLPRARRSTRFVRVLAGRASFAGTASELHDGVYTGCLDAFSSGWALAAGAGVDFHLSDRLALRVAADYRRVAIPSLEGTERGFMRDDADRHLGMMRVAVGFALGI